MFLFMTISSVLVKAHLVVTATPSADVEMQIQFVGLFSVRMFVAVVDIYGPK